MVRVLDGDAHLLEREDGVAAQVARVVERGEVEVAAGVEHLGARGVLEVVVLELGADVEDVAHVRGALDGAREHVARVALERGAVGAADVAEHAGDRVGLRAPRQDLERGGVGERQHVGFRLEREPLDAATIEAHAVGERVVELAGDDGERLHVAHDVGEPEAHEVHVAALDGFEHEVLLWIGGHRLVLSSKALPCGGTRGAPASQRRGAGAHAESAFRPVAPPPTRRRARSPAYDRPV